MSSSAHNAPLRIIEAISMCKSNASAYVFPEYAGNILVNFDIPEDIGNWTLNSFRSGEVLPCAEDDENMIRGISICEPDDGKRRISWPRAIMRIEHLALEGVKATEELFGLICRKMNIDYNTMMGESVDFQCSNYLPDEVLRPWCKVTVVEAENIGQDNKWEWFEALRLLPE